MHLQGLSSFWECHNLRERKVAVGDSLKRSATQRFFDVMEAKETIEFETKNTIGAKTMSKYWQENVRTAESGETISEAFVDACFTVGARLMHNPKTQQMCVMADSKGNTCFDSIYKYEAVVLAFFMLYMFSFSDCF